jgi:hypothetical protein
MNKNSTLDTQVSSTTIDSPIQKVRGRRLLSSRRRVSPWHWFGWLRRKLVNRTDRDFYSLAEKRKHQYAKMAQRAANHHHGFKF